MPKKKDTFEIIGDWLVHNKKSIYRLKDLESIGIKVSEMETGELIKFLEEKFEEEIKQIEEKVEEEDIETKN